MAIESKQRVFNEDSLESRGIITLSLDSAKSRLTTSKSREMKNNKMITALEPASLGFES